MHQFIPGIYIHIPFCRRKCFYCDFFSVVASGETIDLYLKALLAEIKLLSRLRAKTVYVGGGTPSLLEPAHLAVLMTAIRGSFLEGMDDYEFTVELNPESTTREKLQVIRDSGVNRISLGAQSFNEETLKFLGRLHSVDTVYQVFRLAREMDFSNIGLDIIFGLPGETLEDARKNLIKAVTLVPEHLSFYSLSIEPGTALDALGIVKTEEDEEREAQIYEWALDYLAQQDYQHYEISNFARADFFCRHNRQYWQNLPYRGIGAGAVSKVTRVRAKTTTDIPTYIGSLAKGDLPPQEESEEISEEKRLFEEVMLGLRLTSGVSLNHPFFCKYSKKTRQLEEQRLLIGKGGNIRLSRRGLLLANYVWRELCPG